MRYYLMLALMLAAMSTSASAQSGTYLCIPDDATTSFRYRVGPGLLQVSINGNWDSNWCNDSGASCRFEGSRFLADGEDFLFRFDLATGRFEQAIRVVTNLAGAGPNRLNGKNARAIAGPGVLA